MRKTALLLASMILAVLLASGVALAATINCPNRAGNLCVGTIWGDSMFGTDKADEIAFLKFRYEISRRSSPVTVAVTLGRRCLARM